MAKSDEFNKELSTYLAGKKKKKIDVVGAIKGLMPKPTPPPVKLPPDIQVYGDKKEKSPEPEQEKPKVIIEEEPERLEEEIQGKKPSVWKSILEKIKPKPHKKEPDQKDKMIEQEEEGRIREMVAKEIMLKDMRDIAKITLYVIKQLPPERLKEFKQSSDWTDLKEILKKHKLIK